MKLSILIPTLNEPESINYLHRLNNILDPQIARYPGQIEKLIHDAGRQMPTGTKRNELKRNSQGDFLVYIDVDDIVPSYYCDEMMKAIEKDPDVISFIGFMTTNNDHRREFTIKLGEKYEERKGEYFRYPNHLCAMKRSCVENVKFKDIWIQEDYLYATEIRDKDLLKTEVHINDRWMYHYDFKTPIKQQTVFHRRGLRR